MLCLPGSVEEYALEVNKSACTMQQFAIADCAYTLCSGKASAAKVDNKKASAAAPAKAPGSTAKAPCKMPDQLASKAEPTAKPATAKKVHALLNTLLIHE